MKAALKKKLKKTRIAVMPVLIGVGAFAGVMFVASHFMPMAAATMFGFFVAQGVWLPLMQMHVNEMAKQG